MNEIHPSARGRNTSGILGDRFTYPFNDSVADLFGHVPPPTYPHAPGWRGKLETSREAAESIAVRAGTIRARILDLYLENPNGLTSDEVADRLDMTAIMVRPRCAELHGAGLLADTGHRRVNRSGRRAAVLCPTPRAREVVSAG